MAAVTTMATLPAALPATEAGRLRRPSWRDRRLIVGLMLVLASVAVGARAVAAADHTWPVYAARATLPVGTELTGDTLIAVRVRLPANRSRYLAADRPPPTGSVVVRAVGAGELVPVSALAGAGSLDRRPVAIPLDGAPPAGLAVGGSVDVWASGRDRRSGSSVYFPPEQLVQAAPVTAVSSPSAGFSISRAGTVQVLLTQPDLARVLRVLAYGDKVAVVPVPGSAPPGGAP